MGNRGGVHAWTTSRLFADTAGVRKEGRKSGNEKG